VSILARRGIRYRSWKPRKVELQLLPMFWLTTYGLLSLRNALQPDSSLNLVSAKRLLAITLGTVGFWLLTILIDRLGRSPLNVRIAVAGGVAASTAILVLIARYLFNYAVGVRTWTTADEALAVLIWLGYFLAWAGGYLAFLSQAEFDRFQQDSVAAEPLPAESSAYIAEDRCIWVKANRQLVRVAVESIEWIEAYGNYVKVHFPAGSGLLRMSLSSLEDTLDPALFVRVHRSAVCRRDRIRAMRRKKSGAMTIIMTDGVEIPAGRSFARVVGETVGSERTAPISLAEGSTV
jgi:DNA-binding LytR/AlgR family response regulator